MSVLTVKRAFDVSNDQVNALIKEGIKRYGVPTNRKQTYRLAERLHPAVTDMRSSARDITLRDAARELASNGFEFQPAIERSYEIDALDEAISRVVGLTDDYSVVSKDYLDDFSKSINKSVPLYNLYETFPDETALIAIDRLSGAVSRHVYAASRQAIIDTVMHGTARHRRSKKEVRVGYARVLTGSENCAFCAMLASRGAVYSKDTVTKRRDGRKFHDNCDCVARLTVNGSSWEGQEEQKALEEIWNSTKTASLSDFASEWRKIENKSNYSPLTNK